MAEIKMLDGDTVDKIAAGEVVERPASVVKELLENAMDAGADALTVEIKEGGLSFIRVTDNGCGVEKSQVQKAFLRHATSKIKSVEDLLSIKSLGFRGEALSSIAAVSQVEMITKTEEALTGVRYVIEGSKEKQMEEIGAPKGTTVVVRNLFFNTPARRKFLKTAQTEGGYVTDLMEHMAMSRPEISFKYVVNGQVKFHTNGSGDLKEIIYRIYGREIAAELIFMDASEGGMRLTGYLGRPSINRSNRNFENYYVNCRYIKSKLISQAAEEGYKAYLMQHKYPFFVLHFTLDADSLDVNVHPSKMEIRFMAQAQVYDFISSAIKKALLETEMIKEVRWEDGEKEKMPAEKILAPEPFETARRDKNRLEEESKYSVSQKTSENGTDTPDSTFKMQEVLQNPVLNKIIGSPKSYESTKNDNFHANIIKNSEHILVEKPVQMNFFEEKLLTKEKRADYEILGQIFKTYWLVCYEDKLLIIDQHAAHEKVKYERLISQLKEKRVASQGLNPPVIITLSGKEEAAYLEYASYFSHMGFEIEEFGGSEYAIRSVPLDVYGCNEKALFEEIMDGLVSGPVKGTVEVVEAKLASMACKAAVKGNQVLTTQEAEALIDELLTLENPYHCPHGRPTIITMSRYELEKRFSRIV